MISPVSRSATPEAVAVYQTEPYVIAADVYGVAPHVGRGGWTWYTGSAGWMYRVALESVLGLRLDGGERLLLRPCIPAAWPGFTIHYRVPDGGGTTYQLVVSRAARGATTVRVDDADGGATVEDGAVVLPLRRDGAAHRVEVALGADVGPRYRPKVEP
jgi:cyclic beta-1,2-glucan synthetase